MATSPTIQAYNSYADIYDAEVTAFWEQFPSQTIEAFRSALPGTNVLDLGSGSGRDAVLLRNSGLDVTCLDASTSMIAMTQKLGFPSIHTDFSNMNLSGYQFDGIWAYTSLIHVPPEELVKTVTALYGALAANGVLLLGLIQGSGAQVVTRDSMPGAERYFQFYQAKEIDQLMHGAGFSLVFSENYTPRHSTYLNRIYRPTV